MLLLFEDEPVPPTDFPSASTELLSDELEF